MHAAAGFIQGGRQKNSPIAVLEPEAVESQRAAKTTQESAMILRRKRDRLGYVRPRFGDGVAERERTFPTGLKMQGGGNVALPHTDPCHVLKAGVALATLKESVA